MKHANFDHFLDNKIKKRTAKFFSTLLGTIFIFWSVFMNDVDINNLFSEYFFFDNIYTPSQNEVEIEVALAFFRSSVCLRKSKEFRDRSQIN